MGSMEHSEQLLHFIWKYKLLHPDSLVTSDGAKIEVIDPGLQNEDSGPDFFNAKLKFNDIVWVGNVEIHRSSDDWVRHGHQLDKAYNSVILNVCEEIKGEITNQKGEMVAQCKIDVPEQMSKSAEYLIFSDTKLPCKNFLSCLSPVKLNAWLTLLTVERLERKTNDIERHLVRLNNSWDELFYVMLCRSFGFGINSDVFERLAISLPYKYIIKHSDNLFAIEALLFGQAGMLKDDAESFNYDDYYLRLQNEYAFLKRKYSLKGMDGYLFKKMRVRPGSFPEVRLAQLSAILHKSGRMFSSTLKKDNFNDLYDYFLVKPSNYWQDHYTFGKVSGERAKMLGVGSINTIIINTVAPIIFAYGKNTFLDNYCNRAIEILESIKPENNSIIRDFRKSGITPENALESQALIQLRREYCEKRKCFYCRIGRRLLSSKALSNLRS